MRSARARAELQGPPLPELAAEVWSWFRSLRRRAATNGFGPGALTWTDLVHWQQVTGERPWRWQVQWILDLDEHYLQARVAKPQQQQQPKPPGRKPGKEPAHAARVQRQARP